MALTTGSLQGYIPLIVAYRGRKCNACPLRENGVRNFIAQLIWRSDGNFDNQAKIKICHEYILCYSKALDILGLPNGVDSNATESSKIFKDEVRNTLVKNGPQNPMSVVTLPKGFPCAVDELTIEERYDSFPYYHSNAVIKGGQLQEQVDVESGWSSKNIFLSFIILDSFAGSGTTAHAVLNMNKADGGNRKFILVEMSRIIWASM